MAFFQVVEFGGDLFQSPVGSEETGMWAYVSSGAIILSGWRPVSFAMFLLVKKRPIRIIRGALSGATPCTYAIRVLLSHLLA